CVDTKVAASRMTLVTDAAQKTTPLYDEHVRLGAKMIPFGDWIMPVQYSGIMDEHQAVRKNVGVFDISHMGQLIATGPAAAAWLNEFLDVVREQLMEPRSGCRCRRDKQAHGGDIEHADLRSHRWMRVHDA